MREALKELFADDFKESELKGMNAGRIEGKIEGRTEGAASKIIELVIKKHQKGYTAEATADMLEEPVSRIQQIYDVIEKSSPDYDAETIYKQLCEKEKYCFIREFPMVDCQGHKRMSFFCLCKYQV